MSLTSALSSSNPANRSGSPSPEKREEKTVIKEATDAIHSNTENQNRQNISPERVTSSALEDLYEVLPYVFFKFPAGIGKVILRKF